MRKCNARWVPAFPDFSPVAPGGLGDCSDGATPYGVARQDRSASRPGPVRRPLGDCRQVSGRPTPPPSARGGCSGGGHATLFQGAGWAGLARKRCPGAMPGHAGGQAP